MSGRKLAKKPVIASEDFATEVEELLQLAREHGERIRSERAEPGRPLNEEVAAFLTDELRELLEDEIVPAHQEEPEERELFAHEVQREVSKKALIGLRLATLQNLAAQRALDPRGNSEEIAERIARLYRFDGTEIAKLVLDNVEEPTAETGHTTRLFPLASHVDLPAAAERLEWAKGRLVRNGVARWVSVDEVDRDDDELRVNARLLTYKVYVDELGADPSLASSPADSGVVVAMRHEDSMLHAEDAGSAVSRIAAQGVAAVANLQLDRLAITQPKRGRLAAFDPRTVLLLDLVFSRLTKVGVIERNLTIARFVTEKSGRERLAPPDEAQEHSLKAVRFEGNHLLSSPQACQLIAEEGRGLVDISLWVAVHGLGDAADGDAPWFPVRFTIERDHIAVQTGFGRHRPELSGVVQRMLVAEAEKALREGPADAKELEKLADSINSIAESGEGLLTLW